MGIVMTIAATAAKSPFGEAMSAHQTVAANTPAALAATKFSDFLREKQVAKQPLDPATSRAPTPDQLMKSLYGSAHKGDMPLDKIAAEVSKSTAKFAAQLREQMSNAGIDPDVPVELSVGAGGRIIVGNTHPQVTEITHLFEDSPFLAQAFRDTAAENDRLALQQVAGAYIRDWSTMGSETERQMSWKRYSTLMDKLSGMFSGRLTFGPSTVVAESQQMLRRMDIA
jgi:hypothetical protein